MSLSYTAGRHHAEILRRIDLVAETLTDLLELDEHRTARAAPDFHTALEQVTKLRERYDEPFRLAVLGEFSAGKSALINALLGLPDIVPEGAVPTTGAVTELWRGDGTGQVFDAAGDEIFSGTLEEARAYGDQRTPQGRGLSGKGARIVLRVDAEVLDGLVIIDTPGLGASEADDEVTFGMLALADAALLVLSALQPGGEDSVLLAERLRIGERKLMTVVTKIDKAEETQTDLPKFLDKVRGTFGQVASGEPIAVNSRGILAALAAREKAEDHGDDEALARAEELLRRTGHTELHERLAETFTLGDASRRRASQTLVDLRNLLGALNTGAAREAGACEREAERLKGEGKSLSHELYKVLNQKEIFLQAKVSEVVDEQAGALIDHLGAASDAFILDLAEGGHYLLGLKMLFKRGSQRQRDRMQEELQERFLVIFPEETYGLYVETIGRKLKPLMELEWQSTIGPIKKEVPGMPDLQKINIRMGETVGLMVLSGLTQVSAAVLLLLVPGAVLFDAVFLLASSGVVTMQGRHLPGKVQRVQRLARLRLRTERLALANRLDALFQDVNTEVAAQFKAPVEKALAKTGADRKLLVDRARAWTLAAERLSRLAGQGDDHV